MKLLTIVIPAYNMHDYLRRCLDSVCVESVMYDVQVIVVNDGSTDDTSAIAHEYENRYPHYFQVIDKENGNYGSCMNVALPLAECKYFRTLDADDWYDSEAFSLFVEQLKKIDADMILTEKVDHFLVSGTRKVFRFDSKIISNKLLSIDDVDWENESLLGMMGVMFITYRTSILRTVQIRWVEQVPFSDFQYCIQPLQAVGSVCFLPISVYQYQLEREGQSVSLPRTKSLRTAFTKVSEAVVMDFINWKSNIPPSTLQLVRLKMNLLLPNLYRYLYIEGLPVDCSFSRVEEMVKSNPILRALTVEFNEYRGFRYVAAYRKHPFILQLIHWDYRLRLFFHRLFRI